MLEGVRGVRVERVREFGEVYLALSLWRRLGLHTPLRELIPAGRQEVAWETVACVLSVARFCAQVSELGVAERRTAQLGCLAANFGTVLVPEFHQQRHRQQTLETLDKGADRLR